MATGLSGDRIGWGRSAPWVLKAIRNPRTENPLDQSQASVVLTNARRGGLDR
jgi:hypothetical protein